jgi:uncharacterized membrane protein YidH (DUF202 family)
MRVNCLPFTTKKEKTMIFDILNVVGIAVIGYLWWKQNEKIEDLEFMMGYVLTEMGKDAVVVEVQ